MILRTSEPSDTMFLVFTDSEEEKYVYRKGIYIYICTVAKKKVPKHCASAECTVPGETATVRQAEDDVVQTNHGSTEHARVHARFCFAYI